MPTGQESTEEQKAIVIELLAEGIHTIPHIAEVSKVCERSIHYLRKDPEIVRRIVAKAREALKSTLPKIYTALCKKAEEGSYPHIRLLINHIEAIEQLDTAVLDRNITFKWDLDDSKEA